MPQIRTLPHNPEAENAVLGGILLKGARALAEALELVRDEDFYQPRAQAVFRAMRLLEERGEPIDVVTLEAQLRGTGELELVGGIEGLARLDRYATAHNLAVHAELVRQVAQQRNMVVAGREIAEEGMGDVEDTRDFVSRSRARVVDVADARVRKKYRSLKEILVPTVKTITERKKLGETGDTVTGVGTGLADLDGETNGLQPSDLIIVAARPSMGKTAFALSIGLNASVCRQKHWRLPIEKRPWLFPCLFFSLEQPAEQLVERALAAEARVSMADIRSTAPFMRGDFKRVIDAGTRLADAPFAIDDEPALSIDELAARALKWREDPDYWPPELEDDDDPKKRQGLVMVDYLQLARGGKARYDSREQEVSEISRGLKALAKKLKMPVVALAQLNRAVDARADHRPQLSDLRESGAIEQDADVIMFIYREERYLPPDAPADKLAAVANKAEVIIGKQRNGGLGTVHTLFDRKQQRFESVDKSGAYDDL